MSFYFRQTIICTQLHTQARALGQSFPELGVHTGHLSSVKVWALAPQVWGGARDSAFPVSSQVMMMPLGL